MTPRQRRRLGQRQVFIVPTRHGWVFAMLLATLLAGSINYDISLGLLFAFLLLGFALFGMYRTQQNLVGLEFGGAHVEPFHAGQRGKLDLYLRATDDRVRPGLAFVQAGKAAAQPLVARGTMKTVSPGSPALHVETETASRGVFELPRLRLETRYPTGLFIAWAYLEDATDVVVYPETRGDLPLPSLKLGGNEDDLLGVAETHGDLDFSGYRHYRDGDKPRSIAWKTFTASLERGQPPLVKQFNEPDSHDIELSWDQTAVLDEPERRYAQLCRWLQTAASQGSRFSLELPTSSTGLDRGNDHLHHCLRLLADAP